MELRRYRDADLDALVALHNAARAHEHEFIPYAPDRLRRELDGAASIWVAAQAERPVGAAFYCPMWYGNEIVPLTASDADAERVEAELLDRVEADIAGDEAVIAVPSVDAEQIAFLESYGYRAEGGMVQLVADLHAEPAIPELPSDYRLRSLEPLEHWDFIAMVNAAYDAERLSADAFARWRAIPGWREDWVQVVEHRGRLVAGVVARPDGEFNAHYRAQRGYLGPAAVLPEHASRGLGRALTAASLAFVRAQGMDSASLFTTQGNAAVHRLTEHLGFREAHRWHFMKKGV